MNAKDLARQILAEGGDLTEASETLGVALSAGERTKLLSMLKAHGARGLKLETLLTFLERASHGESDLVAERLPVVGLGSTWIQFLGVRWLDGDQRRLTVGARSHWGSARIEGAWPELQTWSRTLSSNRRQAEQWARTEANDRITFELRARPMTSGGIDEVALRAAIADAPDELAPRLVFADWLLEQGNPLGELIHLSLSDKPDLKRLRALDESWQRWAGPLEPYTQRQFVKAGFVTEVTMSVPAFETHGDAFFRAHPVRALSLLWQGLTSEHLKRLSETPALSLVRVLKLERGQFTQRRLSLAPLAEGRHFDRLEELHFAQVGEDAADWRDLLLALRAPKLRKVQLLGTRTSATTFQALAMNPELSGVVELIEEQEQCFEKQPRWAKTFAAIAERLPRLERLRLEGHGTLDDEGLAPLFAKSSKVSLQRLAVRRTAVGSELLRSIAGSPRDSRLTELAVSVDSAEMIDALAQVLTSAKVPLRAHLQSEGAGGTPRGDAARTAREHDAAEGPSAGSGASGAAGRTLRSGAVKLDRRLSGPA